ncbi:PepSY-associated TM helix domain-containing protein [Tistrella bauzanensis]
MTVRQHMSWLHTWAGLAVGWLLFAIFLTGTACYFRPDISTWMHRLRPVDLPDQAAQARMAASWLTDEASDAVRWLIDLPDGREPVLKVAAGRPHGFVASRLDPETGAPETGPDTVGGDFLFYFHFTLIMSDWGRTLGRYLTGICAMIMGVAIVTGVIVHKRIFKDAFTFRPRAAAQRAWLDGHNLLGVMSLPFHLMITWSGLVTLMLLYMPWAVDAAYPAGRAGYAADLDGIGPAVVTASIIQPAPLTDLGPVIGQAAAMWSAPDRPDGIGGIRGGRSRSTGREPPPHA